MSASLVTDKEIENFTLTVIQSEPLIQNNFIRIIYHLFFPAILYNITTQVTVPSYKPERCFITGDENIRKFEWKII